MSTSDAGKKFRQDIKGKNVLVFGLGVLGRGLKDAIYLYKCGANVRVTDLKNESELITSVNKLKKYSKIKLILGEHRQEDILWADIIIKNAGVKPDSVWLKLARENKKKIYMDESLFMEYANCLIVGVTGTKGKSTVTGLIYNILKNQDQKNTYLGGNVLGLATLPLLDKINSNSRVVLELSSWQLQGFKDIKKSPNISVFTNIYPDHLNYYKSMKDYLADKKNIFLWQKKDDYLFINDYQKEVKGFKNETLAKVLYFSGKKFRTIKRKLIGEHNLTNIAVAVEVAKLIGVPEKIINKSVAEYQGEKFRLQLIGNNKKTGIRYINDSAATTVVSLIAGLKASTLEFKGKTVLIFGGSDKNVDWKEISAPLKKYCRALVIINGSAKDKIMDVINKTKIKLPYTIVDSMPSALKSANLLANKNDVILLSPGCASFGVFKNEFDRGEKFNRAVKKYVI